MFTPLGFVFHPLVSALIVYAIGWTTGTVQPGANGLYQTAIASLGAFLIIGALMVENSMMCKQLCCSRCFRMRDDNLMLRLLASSVAFTTRLYMYFPVLSLMYFIGRALIGFAIVAWSIAHLMGGESFWWCFSWTFVAMFAAALPSYFLVAAEPLFDHLSPPFNQRTSH